MELHSSSDLNVYTQVYWENAVQIISPHDSGIAASIKENLEPRTWDISTLTESPLCVDRTKDLIDAYFAQLSTLRSVRCVSTKPASCAVMLIRRF